MQLQPYPYTFYRADIIPVIRDRPKHLQVKHVIDLVSKETGVTTHAIIGKNRSFKTAQARQISYYLSYKFTGEGLKEIGRQMGHKHHTTIMSGRNAVDSLMDVDKELKSIVEKLSHIIRRDFVVKGNVSKAWASY